MGGNPLHSCCQPVRTAADALCWATECRLCRVLNRPLTSTVECQWNSYRNCVDYKKKVQSHDAQAGYVPPIWCHCGSSSVQVKHVTRSFGKASALLVIETIPMFSCPDCSESYFSAQTLHEIERIKALRKSVAVARSVPVASFQLAGDT